MDFKTPNKSWPFKKLMKLGKPELWKMAIAHDDTIKHLGIDYYTMDVLADIVNYELLKQEKE